ncbi:hypothetical protein LPW11_12385 [Geomonas sp. RF6]|uniref:hypothetical protein n=1 Tax=Geomonas sp. RF6 TaxID=2897342 RepID=UPI001E4F292D|nr:hypothetical protein [Geomonas sp. RF6]UFS68707.1 hypothetical protein LPW11_12385 [Geomonas sp. RF6]
MATTEYWLILVITIIATVPMLAGVVRAITAPWRTLATHYPGPAGSCATEISYVTARFWGTSLPFPLTRCIRIRGNDALVAFSIIGFDFLLAKLPEIVVPRSAIAECVPCDLIVPRQRLSFTGAPTTMVVYGRGATFIRKWWKEGGQ